MPDQPVHKEFGQPLSKGEALSDEVFNARYGTYKETGAWHRDGARENPSKGLDPKPFNNLK